ncbi:hypothetical protein F5Y15DRAFT_181374 [Xylariaceae sp. FL0016]|nr:hypothetical protein F5Y15DRAFT_181374 [Xylariaceae sp. FL0016]
MVQQKTVLTSSKPSGNKSTTPSMSFAKKDLDSKIMGGNTGKRDAKINGTPAGFRTDTAITSTRGTREKTLQPWVAPGGSEGVDMSLESSSSNGKWDQFAVNERLFGTKTTYDENIYTTTIDKSHPDYKTRLANADKISREIERSAPVTAHVAEERRMDFAGGDDVGGDEEDKYSGVKRGEQLLAGNRENKYTPPARRAPTAATSVKGAPVDPAIISSQLKTSKAQSSNKSEDPKAHTPSKNDVKSSTPPTTQNAEPKPEPKTDSQAKPAEAKGANQTPTPLRPSAATSRTISPQAKDGPTVAPSATSTVERDVLKEFKTFANQQRINVEKVRSNKAKADKEVKLIELKKFATSFKLPTPVPVDLISIIAKDPAKQREIQEKAQRDAAEVAKRKAEEAASKDKKGATPKDSQAGVASQSSENRAPRPVSNIPTTGPAAGGAPARHTGRMPPTYPSYQNPRSGPHVPQSGRGNLSNRIRAIEQQKAALPAMPSEMRMPPTGPANTNEFPPRRMGMPHHVSGPKLNPNSNEFRPGGFGSNFSPNGHPSTSSSPRSGVNHGTESQQGVAQPQVSPMVVPKKRKVVEPKKTNILDKAKTVEPPEGRSWKDNDGLRPSYDTAPTWRAMKDDESADSSMRQNFDQFFERQPFNAQPTPTVSHLIPQPMPHHHQLPLHMQPGAGHNTGPRPSPHAPAVQMHGGQHAPMPHAPFNGGDDHRMMPSNSAQSFSSPRMPPAMMYPSNMHQPPQMPYGQQMMQFMPPGAQMNNFNRSLSNNGQYIPQPNAMPGQVMMQPQFVPQGMQGMMPPQIFPGGQPYMAPQGGPQSMPVANGYPSPGRPQAPMMAHQGSQQGQPMYHHSPSMQYQQPQFMPPSGQSK